MHKNIVCVHEQVAKADCECPLYDWNIRYFETLIRSEKEKWQKKH